MVPADWRTEEWLECERLRLQHFVDRRELVDAVRDMLKLGAEVEAGAPRVMLVCGVGGCGKSTVLEYLRHAICIEREGIEAPVEEKRGKKAKPAPPIPHAWVDFRTGGASVDSLCLEIASQFAGPPWHIELERFETLWHRYQQLLREAQEGPPMFGPGKAVADVTAILSEIETPARMVARAGKWLLAVSQRQEMKSRLPEGFWKMSAEKLRAYMPQALAEDLGEVAEDPRFAKLFKCARPVVFLDTFESAPREDPGQAAGSAAVREAVRVMCRPASGPLVIVGGRDRVDWKGEPAVDVWELEELSPEDCAAYVASRIRAAGAEEGEPLAGELGGLIHETTGGHALYLGICADIACEALRQGRTPTAADFDPAHASGVSEDRLRYLLDRLLREVPPERRQLVDRAALPLCFDRDILRAMLPPERRADLRGAFGWLTRLSLVSPDRDAPGLYRVQRGVRAIRARWDAEDDPEGFVETHRLVRDHLRERLRAAMGAGERLGGENGAEAEPAPASEMPTEELLAAWAYSALLSDPETAEAELLAVGEQALAHWRLAEAEAVLVGWRQAAEFAGHGRSWRLALVEGRLAHKRGHFHEAELPLSLARDRARAAGNQQGLADATYYLAWLRYDLGRWQEAVELYREALAIHEQLGDQAGVAYALHSMAVVYASRGDLEQAVELYDRSLAAAKELGNVEAQAATLHSMAILHRTRGEGEIARRLCDEALTLARQCGDRRTEAAALHEIGALLSYAGDYAAALEVYDEALAIARDLHDLQGEAATLRDMGVARANQGDYGPAAELCEQGLTLTRDLGDRRGEVHCLQSLAAIVARDGKAARAWDLWEQGLEAARELDDRLSEARILQHMGRARAEQKDVDGAKKLLEEALAIQRAIGDKVGEAETVRWVDEVKA